MKNVKLFGFVVMIVAVLAVAGFAGARGDSPDLLGSTDGTAEIIFDGYCDGMTINFNAGTGISTALYSSSCATCPGTDVLGGFVAYNLAQGSWAFPLSWNTIGGGTPFLYTSIATNHTWGHYDIYTGALFNSGTWSMCKAGEMAPEGAPNSIGLQ